VAFPQVRDPASRARVSAPRNRRHGAAAGPVVSELPDAADAGNSTDRPHAWTRGLQFGAEYLLPRILDNDCGDRDTKPALEGDDR
jgi:hypothetical protein